MKSFFRYCKKHLSGQAIIFVLAFSGYVFLGLCITYPVILGWWDVFFGADSIRVFDDLANIVSYHYRIKVHPLFLLVAQPITLCLDGIINYTPMSIILEEAFCGAMSVSIFFAILKQKCVRKEFRILFTIMYGFSFSNMIFSTIPETFIFAEFFLIGFWYFITIAMDNEGPLSARELFLLCFWGILCFGITLTNYMSYVIGLCCLLSRRYQTRNRWKKLVQVNACNAVSVAALCLFQKFIWKDSPLFWDSMIEGLRGQEYEETFYMDWGFSVTKTITWAKQVFLYPILSPDVSLQGADGRLIQFGGYPSFVYKGLLVLLYCLFFYSIGKNLMRRCKECSYLRWLFVAFSSNLVLHYIYGSQEAFLYSAHFLFLLFVIAALSVSQVKGRNAGKVIQVGLALFCMLEAYNNLQRFFQTANLALGLVGAVFYPLHSVKGACLCGGIAALLYICWMYRTWSNSKEKETVKEEDVHEKAGYAGNVSEVGATSLKIRRYSRAAIVYVVLVVVIGLLIAFNYTMY